MASWVYDGLEPRIEWEVTDVDKVRVIRELIKLEEKKLKSVLCLLALHQSVKGNSSAELIVAQGMIARAKWAWLRKALTEETKKLKGGFKRG